MDTNSLEFSRIERAVQIAERDDSPVTLTCRTARAVVDGLKRLERDEEEADELREEVRRLEGELLDAERDADERVDEVRADARHACRRDADERIDPEPDEVTKIDGVWLVAGSAAVAAVAPGLGGGFLVTMGVDHSKSKLRTLGGGRQETYQIDHVPTRAEADKAVKVLNEYGLPFTSTSTSAGLSGQWRARKPAAAVA